MDESTKLSWILFTVVNLHGLVVYLMKTKAFFLKFHRFRIPLPAKK